MTTSFVVALALAACNVPVSSTGTSGSNPAYLRDACRLANDRCTRCHPLDRVLQARLAASQWRDYVHRMRLMPGSGIQPAEEPAIVDCLAYRSPSETGLAILAREAGR